MFWRYEPDGLGWSPYGMGTAQADGRQVVPDADTRVITAGLVHCDERPSRATSGPVRCTKGALPNCAAA